MAHTALLPNSSFILKPARQVLAGMLRRDTVQFGLKPPLRRLPELSGPPWGARGELSVVTDPACASAWTCGPRGSARPSEPLRRGRARPSGAAGRLLGYAPAQIEGHILAGHGRADHGPECQPPDALAVPGGA